MLLDKEQFSTVEENLAKSGRLSEFESQSGAIKGRMMITRTTIPNGIDVKTIPGKTPQAFEASFDFYDAAVGVAIYTDTMEVAEYGLHRRLRMPSPLHMSGLNSL